MIDSMAVGMAGREGPRPASYFFRAPARVRQQKSLCEADPKTPKALDENAGRRAQSKLRRGCELNVVRFRALTARTQRELNVSITRRCHQKPDKGDTESLEYEDLCAPARGGEGPGESLIFILQSVPYGTGTRAGTLCRSLCERGGKWNPVNGMSLYAASRVTGPAEDLHTILYGGPSRDD